MVSKIKIVLLTSDSYRHQYIAHQLAKHFELSLIVTEKKSPQIENTQDLREEDAEFVKKHFQWRVDRERFYFKEFITFPEDSQLLEVTHGQINSDEVFLAIKEKNPSVIVLFGTSIIKNPLMDFYKGKIINLHLGLSPYYKGSATNLFPILYKEFEAIGATIHIATEKVDDGPILHQLRPIIETTDNLHDIGNKVILQAGIDLPLVIERWSQGYIKGEIIQGSGIICRIKDLSISVLRNIYDNMQTDILQAYQLQEQKRCLLKPIVQNL